MHISLTCKEHEDRTLGFAAAEAERYLGRMLAGLDGEFAVSLEIAAGAPDRNDHFDIRIGTGGGRIAGGNGRGVLIGVYHYLYLLGCRFLGPGKEMELVPPVTDALRLCQSCRREASYHHRGVCIEGAESLENALDFIDWLPKLGYNTCFIQFKVPYTFFARWYLHEGNPLLEPEPFTVGDAERFLEIMTDEIKKRGLILQMVGHGWTGESIGIPSMDWKESRIEPTGRQRSKLALVGGKRAFFHGVPLNTNLCYSDPEVTEAFSESVVRYAQSHPDVDYLHVWLADECNNLCECEKCQKSTPTDQYIHILNRIGEKLTARKLDTRIVFLLYQELLWPPVKERLADPSRFVLMFAPISRSFNSAYQIGGELPPVPEYVRNRITLPVNLEQNMAYLRAWQEHFSGDSFVYDYHLGRAHYGDLGYVHISRIISGDIEQLGKMKLNGQISCQEFRAGMPNFLPNYVMGRKLFDVGCDLEEITREYFQAAYGGGWKEVLSYLTELSELSDCDYFNGKGPRVNADMAGRMRKARALTDAFAESGYFAEEPACAPQARFWEVLRYHCTYAARLEDAIGELAAGHAEEADAAWQRFLEVICEHETAFQPYLDVYRIREVTANYTGFRERK